MKLEVRTWIEKLWNQRTWRLGDTLLSLLGHACHTQQEERQSVDAIDLVAVITISSRRMVFYYVVK